MYSFFLTFEWTTMFSVLFSFYLFSLQFVSAQNVNVSSIVKKCSFCSLFLLLFIYSDSSISVILFYSAFLCNNNILSLPLKKKKQQTNRRLHRKGKNILFYLVYYCVSWAKTIPFSELHAAALNTIFFPPIISLLHEQKVWK